MSNQIQVGDKVRITNSALYSSRVVREVLEVLTYEDAKRAGHLIPTHITNKRGRLVELPRLAPTDSVYVITCDRHRTCWRREEIKPV